MTEIKLFGKWEFKDVACEDPALTDYIAIKPKEHSQYLPHSSARYNVKRFRKASCPIVERLVNALMRHGRNSGKKLLAVRSVKQAFEIIYIMSGKNPIQMFTNAIANCGPREDSTRIGTGGVVRRQAVDVSPLRRVNQGIYLISQGARERSFRNIKTFSECLAEEIIYAGTNDIESSSALKKKYEIERIAKANR